MDISKAKGMKGWKTPKHVGGAERLVKDASGGVPDP